MNVPPNLPVQKMTTSPIMCRVRTTRHVHIYEPSTISSVKHRNYDNTNTCIMFLTMLFADTQGILVDAATNLSH